MLSRIKYYLAVASAAIMGVLYAMLRVQKSKTKVAEEQREKYKSANESNKKTVETQNEIEKAGNSVNTSSDDDVERMLKQYDRSRKY